MTAAIIEQLHDPASADVVAEASAHAVGAEPLV